MANRKSRKKTSEVIESPVIDNAVDAVFVIGTGSQNSNEELRYALRDIEKFCPFVRNVYISGECPDWVDKTVVKHLPWPDRFKHAKDANIIDKLRHACEQPGIAKKILFCSDDQFQTKVCTWDDFAPRWLRRYDKNDGWYESRNRLWHTRLHKTLDRDRRRREASGLDAKNVFYYQPHIWMQIDRDLFIEYAKWSDYEHRDDTIIASGYFNFIDAGGESNYDHIFISDTQSWPVKETHVAYSDSSFKAAMEYLKETFNETSKYELTKEEEKKIKKKIESMKELSPVDTPPPVSLPPPPPAPVKVPPGVAATIEKCKRHLEVTTKEIQERNARRLSGEITPEMQKGLSEHLSVAIAYLNSNSGKPTKLDTALALGEIRVAAQQLNELNYSEEYKMCMEVLEQERTGKKQVTPAVFKTILARII